MDKNLFSFQWIEIDTFLFSKFRSMDKKKMFNENSNTNNI